MWITQNLSLRFFCGRHGCRWAQLVRGMQQAQMRVGKVIIYLFYCFHYYLEYAHTLYSPLCSMKCFTILLKFLN